MLLESDLIPYSITSPVGDKSIVLAPHPDDETLGCGGTMRLLLKSKKHIKVIFLTSGDKADPTALNTFRSLTVDGPRHIEAFWCVDKPLSGEDIARWLSYQART